MEGTAGLIFLAIWAAVILLPCAAIGWLGYRFITKLGEHPSKTAVLQKDVMLTYIVIFVASMTAILVFFKVISAE